MNFQLNHYALSFTNRSFACVWMKWNNHFNMTNADWLTPAYDSIIIRGYKATKQRLFILAQMFFNRHSAVAIEMDIEITEFRILQLNIQYLHWFFNNSKVWMSDWTILHLSIFYPFPSRNTEMRTRTGNWRKWEDIMYNQTFCQYFSTKKRERILFIVWMTWYQDW